MSGDWIKMRGNLWDDPRIAAICDDTDATEASVIGALYWLWASADQHTEDGTMPGLSLRQIDRKTGVAGFAAAVVRMGWLSEIDGGVLILRFEEHNGSSAKRRCTEAKRKANARNSSAVDADTERTYIGSDAELEKELEIEKEVEEKEQSPAVASDPAPAKPKRAKSVGMTLGQFTEQCRSAGEQVVPADDPIFSYAEKVGLPVEFVALGWRWFKGKYGTSQHKQADWRAHFRNSVRSGWCKYWAISGDGAVYLTTAGKQAQREANA